MVVLTLRGKVWWWSWRSAARSDGGLDAPRQSV